MVNKFDFTVLSPREQRRARPGKKAKEHKKELAELVAKQREVETLTYLDTGEEDTAPDEGGFEEATDVLGEFVSSSFDAVSQLYWRHLQGCAKEFLSARCIPC